MQFIPHYSSSSGNLYSMIDGDTRLLLECGVSINRIRRAVGFNLGAYTACLLTHCHGDHATAATDVMRAGLDLYCSDGTADQLGLRGHRLHKLERNGSMNERRYKTIGLGGTMVTPYGVQHDAPQPVGYLITGITGCGYRLLFATDTYYIRYKFDGLTHICVECNYSEKTISDDIHPAQRDRLLASHMSLETLLDMLAANDLSQVREIHLLHLSDSNADADCFRDTVMQVTGRPVFVAGKEPE